MNAFIFIGWRFFFAGFAGLSASAISLAEELPPGELVGASEEIVRAARIAATSAASEEAAAALEVLGRAASAGDPLAALAAGFCMEHGLGTAKSPRSALASYKIAADAGLAAGMRRYGIVLRGGNEEAPPDYSAARRWLGKAEAAGDTGATLELARMDFAGEGIAQPDPGKARFVWQKAAEAGSAEAMVELGRGQKLGVFGDQPDFAEARRWFEQAASKGDAVGSLELGFLYEEGAGVPVDIDRALFHYRAAAEGESPEAWFHLGMCALKGLGGEKDDRQALEWFEKAADAGFPQAMYQVATFQETGRAGLSPDPAKALEWHRKAAGLGHAPSQNQLGSRYLEGRGIKADPAEAYKWLSAAASQRFPAAMVNLGAMYEKGFGEIVARDHAVAARLYTEAAKLNDPVGQFLLARLFNGGNGVVQDPVAAYVLAVESARLGHKPAESLRDTLKKQLTPAQLETAKSRLEQARPGKN